MSFVSQEFAALLAAVLSLFLFVKQQKFRKIILLIASCIFYAYWDWRYLGLLMIVTVIDYSISRFLENTQSKNYRKLLLWLSVLFNLSVLGFFKYFNFFIDSFNVLLRPLGFNLGSLQILLPIGISFFIFETLSYIIDVYRGDTRPANSLIDYAIFITFFPRLVAGPIMRAKQFLPQLETGIFIKAENILTGLDLFLRGMFKKLVLADNMALMVDRVYMNPSIYSPATNWLTILAYSVQILCDFSGYTDMALGTAKMIGFELPQNFNLPYTARSFSGFWRRWHISLSTWFRDYLYIPLGGNRKGKTRTYINLMITMLLGGLWHGASWNFVFWGGLHGSYLSLERFINSRSHTISVRQTNVLMFLKTVFIFVVVSVTWVYFRSPTINTSMAVFSKLLFVDRFGIDWFYIPAMVVVPSFFLGGYLWCHYNLDMPQLNLEKPYTLAYILFIALVIFYFAAFNPSPFIYFQF